MNVTIEIPEDRAARFQRQAEARGLTVDRWLLELGDHGADIGTNGRLRLRRRVPIPIRPKRVQSGRGARHQQRSQRTREPAFFVAHQRYGYHSRGDRGHESRDDDKSAHSSSGMRERCRTTR